MISLQSARITDVLPEILTWQPWTQAFAFAVRRQVQRIERAQQSLAVWCAGEDLTEEQCDALALELKTPQYAQSMPLTVKRSMVRNTLLYYASAGTKAVVCQIATDVFGDAEVQEWFTYGGKPFTFKIVSKGITSAEEKAQCKALIETVKRLSAHLDGFVALIEHVFRHDNRFCFHALRISAAFYHRGVRPVLFDGAASFDGALSFDQWEDARIHLRKLCLRFVLPSRNGIRALWHWHSRFQQAMRVALSYVQLQARFWNRRQVSYRMAVNVAAYHRNTVNGAVFINRTHDFNGDFLFDGSKAFNAGITQEEF